MEKEIETKTKTITLMPYLPEHLHQLSQFYLPDTQTPFSALPDESLKYCREDCDRHSIVILAKGIPVGFFVLHIGENITRFTSDKKAILLRGFLIDQNIREKVLRRKPCKSFRNSQKGFFQTRIRSFWQ